MSDNLVEWSQGQFPIYHIFKLQIKKMTSNLSSKTTYLQRLLFYYPWAVILLWKLFSHVDVGIQEMLSQARCFLPTK